MPIYTLVRVRCDKCTRFFDAECPVGGFLGSPRLPLFHNGEGWQLPKTGDPVAAPVLCPEHRDP